MKFRAALRKTLDWGRPRKLCQFEGGYWPETVERWRREGLAIDAQPWEGAGITHYQRVPVDVRIFPPFEEKVLEERPETRVVQDANGIIKEVRRDGTAFPNFLKHPVQTLADFEALKERLNPNTVERFPVDWYGAVSELKRSDIVLVMGGVEISFFGWHRDLMGAENLLLAYYDQPELVHAISRHHVSFLRDFYSRIALDVEFDFIFIWEDMSYKNGPLISPALVREFMLPYYRELIPFLKHISGCKVILDSDGDVSQLIPLFMEAGVDGMLPFECAAGMNVCEIGDRYPDLLIAGGIDKREIAKGRKHIDRELDAKLPHMFRRGGYLPAMDHHVPPEVGYDDVLYYTERTREIYRRCR